MVAAATLLLTGCDLPDLVPTGGGPGRVTSADADTTPEQTAWMTRLCEDLDRVRTVAVDQADFDRIDTDTIADTAARSLRSVGKAADELIGEIDALGPPPVDNGDKVLDELRTSFQDERESIEKAARYVEEADPSNVLEGVQAVRAAQTGIRAISVMTNEVSDQPALEQAFAATPTCQAIGSGATGEKSG